MAINLPQLLSDLVSRGASDLHIKARTPIYLRLLGHLEPTKFPVVTPEDLDALSKTIFAEDQLEILHRDRQVDGVYRPEAGGPRYRVSACYQRGTLSMVFRHIPPVIPTLQDLGVPEDAAALLNAHRGLILVTGPASSGKTTTVASLIEAYNQVREAHIVTLEDPPEFLLESKHCLINQRHVGRDTPSFDDGLRHVLRQDPDIIYVGELRDLNTASIAMAAAETGHLVLSTLQTPDSATTLEQLVGLFPAQQQPQARLQLSLALAGIVSQQLVTTQDGKRRIAVFEVLTPNEALRNLIRQNQTFRITDALETTQGCVSMRRSLSALASKGVLSPEDLHRLASS